MEQPVINEKTGNASKTKTLENLKKSRARRATIVAKYGGVPTSVWEMDFTKNKLIWDPRPRQEDVSWKSTGASKELDKAWSLCNKSVRHGGQSTLPYDMMERVVKFYSEPGETVLDPTMGDPTAMTVTHHLKRNFIGYDISEENFNINVELKKKLMGENAQKTLFKSKNFIDIYKKSSECMDDLENESVDMVFFSPPYWDLEFYGEEEGQLGFGNTYEEFLAGLGNVVKEAYRTLKYGKYCAININDFVKKGKFYDYHMDLKKLMDDAGFRRHDTIIIVWKSCIGQAFASQVEDWKKTAKRHEYILIGKKVKNKDEYNRKTLDDGHMVEEELGL